MRLLELNEEIISCDRCSRLLDWASSRQGENPRYLNQDYWGKPVPSFGDEHARILIIGLAPGAHGANRTGRPFTGDVAGDYLFRALYRFGYSNSEVSIGRSDGLVLCDTYITNAVRCVPPKDKPDHSEIIACRNYLRRELNALTNLKVILVLGEKAFNQAKAILKERGANINGVDFRHQAVYDFGPDLPFLVVSFHTSQRNINRKIMSDEILNNIFERIAEELRRRSVD